MKRLFIVLAGVGILFFFFYKPSHQVEDMKIGIASSFYKKSGFEVSEVKLFRVDDYKYTGIVVLKDNSQALIDVTVDKDDKTNYMWQCTQPSPSMMQGLMDKALNTEQLVPAPEAAPAPAPAPAP